MLFIGLCVVKGVCAQGNSGLKIIASLPIKSNGGWDYITADAGGKRLFVSHGTQVNILSTTGDSLGVIKNTNGVHGIALVKSLNKGYTSNGKDNSLTAFDLTTYNPIISIPVGANPDAIFYDESAKKIFAFNGKSHDASVVDPISDKVVATIPLDGKPETGVADNKGHVFVNSENTSEVIVINDVSLKVEKRFKIDGGEEPSGLAIDPATNRLFVGCAGNGTLIVMDAGNGKTIAKFKIGDCDGTGFDPALKLIYTSNNEGTLSVVKELSASKFVKYNDVKTEAGARTIAVDPVTHKIYLPAAKAKPDTAGSNGGAKPRRSWMPGSFHVLVVGK